MFGKKVVIVAVWGPVLVCGLSTLGADVGNPLDFSVQQNPLRKPPAETPKWTGSFKSRSGIRLIVLTGKNGALTGELVVGGGTSESRYPVSNLRKVAVNRLQGEFSVGSVSFPLQVEASDGERRFVLTSGPHRHDLEREVPGPEISRNPVVSGRRSPRVRIDEEFSAGAGGRNPAFSRNVVFNGTLLDDATLTTLEQGLGIQIPESSFWYDPLCGAVGLAGGPTLTYFPAGLRFCGRLSPLASGGGTQVVVNDRILHPQDVFSLQALLGPIIPGRYWLDHDGNYGVEGGPVAGNLLVAVQARMAAVVGGEAGGGDGGSGPWSVYRRFPGADGSISVGGDGNGDIIISTGSTTWWPGK